MDLIGSANWSAFNDLMNNDATDTFFKDVIIWRRVLKRSDRFGEDVPDNISDVTLKCLCNYNYTRSWPVTGFTETGGLDKESVQVLFNRKYLRDNGYLNSNDYFEYNEDRDRFILDGLVFKPTGDTSASSSDGGPLLITVVLLREKSNTGEVR